MGRFPWNLLILVNHHIFTIFVKELITKVNFFKDNGIYRVLHYNNVLFTVFIISIYCIILITLPNFKKVNLAKT